MLPEVALRQWVLTFPFAWRRRLAQDGALLGALTRIFVETVHTFYAKRAAALGAPGAKTGALTVVQRTSSDLRLNPHLHVIFLDGSYRELDTALGWEQLGHLQSREVGEVLERALRRMKKYLRRRGALATDDADGSNEASEAGEAGEAGDESAALEGQLLASAVCGQTSPAGPQWLRGLAPLRPSELAFDKPLCAALDGFTLHAATRAGALDTAGREKLLRYVLRPPLAQERVELLPDGLVRIVLKRAYADGTRAVEMDPLSLLCRLATSVPTPRYHTVKYSGVLASASPWRSWITPAPPPQAAAAEATEQSPAPKRAAGNYRPWAELLRRTFGEDVLACPKCQGRMKLLAMVTDERELARYLAHVGESMHVPARAPSRGPPYWKSTVLRRKALDALA